MKRGIIGPFLILLLLVCPSVFSIGLSPTKYDVAFEPFLNRTFGLTLMNTGEYPVNASVKFGGPLSQYVQYTPSVYPLQPGSTQLLSFTITLPGQIDPPGKQTIDIIAEELVSPAHGEFAVTTNTVIKLNLDVPYPGKYLELGSSVSSVNEGDPVLFMFSFANKGREDIVSARGLVDLFDSTGNLLATRTTTPVSVLKSQSSTATVSFTEVSLRAGVYLLRYLAEYDNKVTPSQETSLRVGTLVVNVTDYTHILLPDAVNRFEISLQSLWNTKIDDIYGTIILKKDNISLIDPAVTLNSYLDPWSYTRLTAFVDTHSLEPGSYDAEITLLYQDTSRTVLVPIEIASPPYRPSLLALLVVFIVLLLILFDALFLYVRRRRDRSRLHQYKDSLYKDLLGGSP